MKPRECLICREPNTPTARVCSNCRMILSYEAYLEKEQAAEQNKKELAELKKQQVNMQRTMASMMRVPTGQSHTVKILQIEGVQSDRFKIQRCNRQ